MAIRTVFENSKNCSHPLVSIGVPTYNRAKDLKRAVQSVLNQDYPNIELVISDNASLDETERVCREFCRQDPRVRYLRQENNKGPSANFGQVLTASKGEYFMWLGDDDFLDKFYVSSCIKFLQEHSDYSLVCGKATYFSNETILGLGSIVNLPESEGKERTLEYYRKVSDNGTYYGLMKRSHIFATSFGQDVLGAMTKETLGSDWLLIGEIAFLGKIKTLENTSVFRSTSGISKNASALVTGLNLPSFLAKMIWVNISATILKSVAWSSPVYKSLGIFARMHLGIKATWSVFERCSYLPWKYRRRNNWLAFKKKVKAYFSKNRIERKLKLAQMKLRKNELSQAESLYQEVLVDDSGNFEALHDLGIIAFQRRQFQTAVEWFLKVIKAKPDFPAVHNNLGVVCYSMGRPVDAMACYESALKFNPDYAEAHFNRGLIFRDREEYREAIIEIEKALMLKPDYDEAQKELEKLKLKRTGRVHLTSIPLKNSDLVPAPKKRIAYIDLAFHQKTKSTLELVDTFKKYYQVDIYWDDGNLDFRKMAEQGYESAIFFQRIYGLRRLKTLKIKNIVMIPMYDDVLDITDYYWQQFENVKFLNFSKTLHEKIIRLGRESKYIPYYISPATLPEPNTQLNGLSGFLWQRTNYIQWNTVKKLISGTSFRKFHLHSAVDPPNHRFERPSLEDIQNYNISISDWFQGKDEYLSKVNASNVFFAPRLFEGIGMSFLEAMAMGKCVVAPNFPTMNEYIQHGLNGLLYDPVNPQPLDFSQVDKLGLRARKSAEMGYLNWKEKEEELIGYISGDFAAEKMKLMENII